MALLIGLAGRALFKMAQDFHASTQELPIRGFSLTELLRQADIDLGSA